MRLTSSQVEDLYKRMISNGEIEEVEIVEGSDGRVQFYTIEVKRLRRPLKKVKTTDE